MRNSISGDTHNTLHVAMAIHLILTGDRALIALRNVINHSPYYTSYLYLYCHHLVISINNHILYNIYDLSALSIAEVFGTAVSALSVAGFAVSIATTAFKLKFLLDAFEDAPTYILHLIEEMSRALSESEWDVIRGCAELVGGG